MKYYFAILAAVWTLEFAGLLYIENDRLETERIGLKLFALDLEIRSLELLQKPAPTPAPESKLELL